MKFTEFDKKNLRALRLEMQKLLDKYGAESNLTFQVGNMNFTSSDVNIKVSAKIIGAESREDKLLKQMMKMYNLQETGVGGQKLVGYKPKNRKYPFIYEHRGKLYKQELSMTRLMFRKAA